MLKDCMSVWKETDNLYTEALYWVRKCPVMVLDFQSLAAATPLCGGEPLLSFASRVVDSV